MRRRARRRARRDPRLGRPPRQRHPGHLLERSERALLLDARDPLYPGTGAPSERGEHDTIVNAPFRGGDGSDVFRERSVRHPAAHRGVPPRPHRDLGRLRCPLARPARRAQSHRGRFRLGDQADGYCRRRAVQRSCPCWRGATTWRVSPTSAAAPYGCAYGSLAVGAASACVRSAIEGRASAGARRAPGTAEGDRGEGEQGDPRRDTPRRARQLPGCRKPRGRESRQPFLLRVESTGIVQRRGEGDEELEPGDDRDDGRQPSERGAAQPRIGQRQGRRPWRP